MAQPTSRLSRRLSADTLRQAAKATEIDQFIFLAGPYIEPDTEPAAGSSESTFLRYHLFHRLQGDDLDVSLGEYKKLIDAHKDVLGSKNNAAVAELNHARETATAIVIILDSPGSFAEIGTFCIYKEVCEKMLIISDVRHQASTGYLNQGPISMAASFGAKIQYVDFRDVDECYNHVAEFIEDVRQKLVLREMIRTS